MSGGAGRAFARAKAMMAAVMSVLSQGLQPLAQLAALQGLGEYESRGKGKGRWGGHKYNARLRRKSTAFSTNGAQECARRRKQIAAGVHRGTPVFFPIKEKENE